MIFFFICLGLFFPQISTSEGNNNTYFSSGIRYFNSAKYLEASHFFKAALKAEDNALFQTYLGVSYYYIGKEEKAKHEMLAANTKSPGIVKKITTKMKDHSPSIFWAKVEASKHKGTEDDPIQTILSG